MYTIQLTTPQLEAANLLGQGAVVHAYNDEGVTRMETENGRDPYEWKDGSWVAMKN